jgi:ubiquinone biosynthesis protein UbiJ
MKLKLINLSSTIDEVYANVSKKIDTDATQIREYMDDKFRAVSGDVQLARNAEEISKVNYKLGKLQKKLVL